MKRSKEEFILELLAKPEFKKWVLEPNEESDYFWSSWIKEHDGALEAIQTAREIILRIQFDQIQLAADEEDEILRQIISKSSTNTVAVIRRSTTAGWLRYAAILAFVMSCVFILYNWTMDGSELPGPKAAELIQRNNPKGQKSVVHLPDGSLVYLNSSSSLKYYSDFVDRRYLELEGEAYFEVAEDINHPFTVKSGGILTTALGTAFNVNTKSPVLEVILVEGKVRVSEIQDAQSFEILKPNERIAFDETAGLLNVEILDNLGDILWTQGVLYFDETPFLDVIETLEDWYGVEIVVKGELKIMSFSGTFEKEYLSNVLNAMSFSLGFEYKIDKKKVEIKQSEQMKRSDE